MLPEGLGDVADVGSDVAMVGGEVPMVGGELPQVDIIVERAMAMVPKAPEIQTLMVRKALERWDLGAADSAARQAVAEHPNYAAAHHWYGVVLGRQGRFGDALRELEAARSLDPLSRSINTDLGELYYASGRFDDAIQQLRRTVERHPRHVEARVNLALALAASGEGDAAIAELRKAVELAPGNPVVLGHIGQVLADAGRREEAEIILQDLLHRAERQSIPPSAVAQIYAGLGDREAAVRWLERAADERSSALVSPRVGRLFGDLRQDPRLARVFDLVPRGPQPPHVPQPPTADSSRVRRPPPR
jgi:tetratricopeptide (TPR) repeat protein